MRPLVAVAGLRAATVTGLRRLGIGASERVLEAVYRAGADPVVLPPLVMTGDVDLSRFAGVVVPGGNDLDPQWYGQERDPSTGVADLVHDRCDLDLVRGAIDQRVPLLAICRGMQVLNVALGGTLVQDLAPTDVPHREGMHDVSLVRNSAVARAMGQAEVSVSSYHHQAIDLIGEGLRATGRTSDGCVEALEHDSAPILAVQWHPEDDAHEQPYEQALFDSLLVPERWYRPTPSESEPFPVG